LERLGILGGAFNPPHVGHMVCAQEARTALGLDRVMLIPMGVAPHRAIEPEPGRDVRLRMCRLAAAGDDGLEVSSIECDREGPSYTVETLRELSGPERELMLLLGADQAAALRSWREPEEVLRLARVAVASRSGMDREGVLRRLGGLEGHERIEFFDMPRLDVSSTMVRERVAAGKPIRWLVAAAVEELVGAEGLYASATVGAQ
jgi:nicotinate-nucleotide adenylyltransferase